MALLANGRWNRVAVELRPQQRVSIEPVRRHLSMQAAHLGIGQIALCLVSASQVPTVDHMWGLAALGNMDYQVAHAGIAGRGDPDAPDGNGRVGDHVRDLLNTLRKTIERLRTRDDRAVCLLVEADQDRAAIDSEGSDVAREFKVLRLARRD